MLDEIEIRWLLQSGNFKGCSPSQYEHLFKIAESETDAHALACALWVVSNDLVSLEQIESNLLDLQKSKRLLNNFEDSVSLVNKLSK